MKGLKTENYQVSLVYLDMFNWIIQLIGFYGFSKKKNPKGNILSAFVKQIFRTYSTTKTADINMQSLISHSILSINRGKQTVNRPNIL